MSDQIQLSEVPTTNATAAGARDAFAQQFHDTQPSASGPGAHIGHGEFADTAQNNAAMEAQGFPPGASVLFDHAVAGSGNPRETCSTMPTSETINKFGHTSVTVDSTTTVCKPNHAEKNGDGPAISMLNTGLFAHSGGEGMGSSDGQGHETKCAQLPTAEAITIRPDGTRVIVDTDTAVCKSSGPQDKASPMGSGSAQDSGITHGSAGAHGSGGSGRSGGTESYGFKHLE